MLCTCSKVDKNQFHFFSLQTHRARVAISQFYAQCCIIGDLGLFNLEVELRLLTVCLCNILNCDLNVMTEMTSIQTVIIQDG